MSDDNTLDNELINDQQDPNTEWDGIGIQGEQGDQGERGPRGETGEPGIQGPKGFRGIQGPQGPQGSLGYQGYQGAQGVQGTRGCVGPQGVTGGKGVQGAQGIRGEVGPQGTRGCEGTQGPTGSKGVQGVQGTRGEPGIQGPRGMAGKQGAQGPTGSKGRNGYMGYQGPSGDVGVQGVQGKEGAVWYDGIRLNGYNTHLFVFNGTDKFVPTEESPNTSENNLLNIKNGATIKLWIDGEALAFLNSNNGRVKIDNYHEGQTTPEDGELTQFFAYFSGTTLITEKIDENDLDCVIELTYRDDFDDESAGAWYYTGGSIGGASDAVITQPIRVTGVNIGQFNDGDTVPTGTTMQEMFEKLLVKEIDVTAINPVATLKLRANDRYINNNGNIEIGSSVDVVAEIGYRDGRFVGMEGYTYSADANCEQTGNQVKVNGEIISGTSWRINSMPVGVISVQGLVSHSRSQTIPVKNTGEPSDVYIPEGTVGSKVITLTGMRVGYAKCVDAIIESTISIPVVGSQSDLETGDWTTIDLVGNTYNFGTLETTDEKPSHAITVPAEYCISRATLADGTEVPVRTTWVKQNEIDYRVGENAPIKYATYVLPSTGSVKYYNVTISKEPWEQ